MAEQYDGNAVSVDTSPKESQTVQHGGKDYTTIREGSAYILIPKPPEQHADNSDKSQPSVFYNPIQQFNRDLSVLVIKAFGEDLLTARKSKREKSFHGGRKKKRKVDAMNGGGSNHEVEQLEEVKKSRTETSDGHENGTAATSEPKIETTVSASADALMQDVDAGEIVNKVVDIDIENLDSHDQGADKNAATHTSIKQERLPKFTILDALSATGLRALRYAKEIPFTTAVTANDLSPGATESIKLNTKHNRLDDKITTITGNALSHMYSFVGSSAENARSERKYDVIDLDPYGTAAPFLDAAIHAINDGGLLCVTCTDAGVFASVGYPEKTYSLYGGTPIRGYHSHEGGLRLILHAIATSAGRQGMAIEPLLSLSIDYYARVFVRIRRSAAEVKFLAGKTMLVYGCDSGCGAWQTQFLSRNEEKVSKDGTKNYKHSLAQGPTGYPNCEHCGFKTHMSGPMYGGPIHNPAFIQYMLRELPKVDQEIYKTTARIEGMLTLALEESIINSNLVANDGMVQVKDKDSIALFPRTDPGETERHPFFFQPSSLARVLRCQAPSEAALKGALRHAGFKATRSHCKPDSIRTDAPWKFIWHMMREWVSQRAPIKPDVLKKGTAGYGLMERAELTGVKEGAASASIVFDEALGRERGKKVVRYPLNPAPNWGPMTRASAR